MQINALLVVAFCNQEVITLLEWAVDEAEYTAETTLASIRRRRFFDPVAAGAPDSTTLLRQERNQ